MIKILDLVHIKFPLPNLQCYNGSMVIQLTYTVSEHYSIVWIHIMMIQLNGIIYSNTNIK